MAIETNATKATQTQQTGLLPSKGPNNPSTSKVDAVAHFTISTFVQAFKRSLWTVFQYVCLPFALLSPSARKELYFETAAIKQTWNRLLVRIGCADFDSPFTPALLDKAEDLLNDPTFNARVFSGRGRFLHNTAQAAHLIKHKDMSALEARLIIEKREQSTLKPVADNLVDYENIQERTPERLEKLGQFAKGFDNTLSITPKESEHYILGCNFNNLKKGIPLSKIKNEELEAHLHSKIKKYLESIPATLETEQENFAEEALSHFQNRSKPENSAEKLLSSVEKQVDFDFKRDTYVIIQDGTKTRTFSHGKENGKEVSAENFCKILEDKVGKNNYKTLNTILACAQQGVFAEQMILPTFINQRKKDMANYIREPQDKSKPLTYSIEIKDATVTIQSTSFQSLMLDILINDNEKRIANKEYHYEIILSRETGESLSNRFTTTVHGKIPSSELLPKG